MVHEIKNKYVILIIFFKEFNVLDTQPGGTLALQVVQAADSTFLLTAVSLFLFLILLLCLALCMNQRFTYQRKLKAATATAYSKLNIFNTK